MIIDTHCHLDFPELYGEIDAVIDRAREAGVKSIINVASNLDGCLKGADIARRYENIFYSIGIHPHHAGEVTEQDLARVEDLAGSADKKCVAIGEVGLDFYRNLSPADAQARLFARFLDMSKRRGLPVIIHSREAGSETFRILSEALTVPVRGVMHCFSQDRAYLGKILDLGMHVSFTCNVTYKNAGRIRDVVKYVPADRLLIETDAPFLAPQKFRGTRNEPAYLVHLVAALQELLGKTPEDIARETTRNAQTLFRLG
ncbi:MAG: TatD family hydrolase [Candidatus Omnitrophica bacterium]|nr:TatD family hydrolase [Candidatus Omnitrophota bacterium]